MNTPNTKINGLDKARQITRTAHRAVNAKANVQWKCCYDTKRKIAEMYRCENGRWVKKQDLITSDEGLVSPSIALAEPWVFLSGVRTIYVFRRIGKLWIETQKIEDIIPQGFGYAIDIEGNKANVASFMDHTLSEKSGTIYQFGLQGYKWVLRKKLL